MSRFRLNNNAFQKYLFLLGGIAFGLSLLKNIFLEQHPGTLFYMMEFLSFMFFLAAIFVSDRNNQKLRERINQLEQTTGEERRQFQHKIDGQNEIIAAYEAKENEQTRFASYQEKVLKKLINSNAAGKDKHQFLYSIGELFHAMAVVLYKKEEQDGHFVVEATFGIPDDAEVSGFEEGEGLHGQAASDGKPLLVEPVPEDYIEVETALGKSDEYYLYLLPIVKENVCTGMIELLTFKRSQVSDLWPSVMEQLVKKEII